jgi:hypothetical protein
MFPGHSYDQAMNIEVPIRKWLMRRWNKQKEAENNAGKKPMQDLDTPLSQTARQQYLKK